MLAKEQRFIERFSAHAAKAAQVQSRVKALEKIEKIELPRKRRVVRFDFPPAAAFRRSGGCARGRLQGVRRSRRPRRVEHDHQARRALVRHGQKRSGEDHAPANGCRRARAGLRERRLGASLKMGYFAQQALDLLDPDLTIEEQLQRDFPDESIGVLRNLAGAFQFSGDDIDKKIRSLSGGEKTRLVMARMLLDPAELPGARRADQSPGSLHEGNAHRGVERISRARCSSSRTIAHSCVVSAIASSSWAGRAGSRLQPHLYPGSYVEYVTRTGHEAPGVHS